MYSYENYSQVKGKIEKRRTDARAEADYRNEMLREKSPEIAKIDAELSSTGLLLFKAACSGGSVAEIRERNAALCKRRKEVVVSLGYPEDYTEVKYTCGKCSDTGFDEDGKMCSCFKEELVKATIASSGIGKLIEKQSFENFDLDWYKKTPGSYDRMAAILAEAKLYVKNFPKKRGNLLLLGTTGTGKTHISTSIAADVIKQGYDVVYDTAQNIFSDFEFDRFKNGYGREESRCDKYMECDLLIIDDLGTEFSSQFTLSCLYNLINTRQNRGLGTIISTNLDVDDLSERYEARIYSRLLGENCKVLPFDGVDHRLFGKTGRK